MSQEKSAGVIIFRKEDNETLFLLLRTYIWGQWNFPKGNIESGENEKEAALREAREETGLNNFNIIEDFKEKIEYYYKKRGETVHKEVIYFLAGTDEKDIKLSFEHKGYTWLNFEQALKLVSFDNSRELLKKAKKLINQVK